MVVQSTELCNVQVGGGGTHHSGCGSVGPGQDGRYCIAVGGAHPDGGPRDDCGNSAGRHRGGRPPHTGLHLRGLRQRLLAVKEREPQGWEAFLLGGRGRRI